MRPLLCSGLLLAVVTHAAGIEVATPIDAADFTLSASSMWSGITPQNVVNGAGMDAEDRHDNESRSATSWHTAAPVAPTAAAPGLPAAPAWLRFDFKEAKPLGRCQIWNHNQADLTDRGFRHAQLFISSDGTKWEAVRVKGSDTFEIPRAKGSPAEPATLTVDLPDKPVKSAVLLAKDNHGGNVYGLSAVRFAVTRDVPEAKLPAPTELKAVDFPFVDDGKGGWSRSVTVSLDAPLYQAAQARVTAGGKVRATTLAPMGAGRKQLVLPLPDGVGVKRTATDKIAVEVKGPGWTRTLETSIAPSKDWPELEEIIVVVKTHYDIGYTHRVKEVVDYYRTTMIDRALGAMESSRSAPPDHQYSFTMPGWVLSKVVDDWKGQTPERKAKIDDFVKSGRFRYHAMPFSLESDVCEPEEMARGFSFASGISRRYGLPLPVSGKTSDVPCQGTTLATVAANAGLKFMHIGSNWPSGYVTTPGLFWWEGPDGSRVLTLYSSTYGSGTGFNWPDNWGGGEPLVGKHFLPPANWPYKIWPAILVTMDNSGPPSAQAVEAYFEEAKRVLPGGIRIRMGTMDDFANAFLADPPANLPVVKAEMPDTWIHGVMSDPRGSRTSRAVHAELPAAEFLRTELAGWGTPLPPVTTEVARAYENILLYGEHTWGVSPAVNNYGESFKAVSPKLIDYLEGSWEDKTNYIREADRITGEIATENLKALAGSVAATAGDLVVFNPLPWTRSDFVEAGGKRVFVREIPPCGYKVVRPDETAAPADVLESPFYKVVLDPATGSIASLVDKRSGREWVDPKASWKLGQYLNERFTYEQTRDYTVKYQSLRKNPWQPHPGMHKGGMVSEKVTPYRAAGAANGTITRDARGATLACPADPANHKPATELRVTLDQAKPVIDLELTIRDKAKDNWPEADWFSFPFKVETPSFRVYRQLGVMDPVTGILPGANRDLFSVGHGVTITDADGAGVSVMPLDHPLVSLDRPGIWKFSKDAADFTPKAPVVYVNLYNNQWNTNFRYWYTGDWSSRVRLTTFDAKTPATESIAVPALEGRHPLTAVVANGASAGAAKLPSERAGLAVSRRGIIVTAFGEDPDGHPGKLLRVWDQSGESGELTVTLPEGSRFTTATSVDLRGEHPGEKLAIREGKLVFSLRGWSPASFILE
jgi:alpha-mannosidase